MSLLAFLVATSGPSADKNESGLSKLVNSTASLAYVLLLALAVFLAVRDMSALHTPAPKIWLICLAVFAPELYVILHGLSSSSMGMPFFSDALVEVPASLAHASASVTPSDATDSLSRSVAAKVSSTLRKAAAAVKSEGSSLSRAASKLVDSATSSGSSSVPLSGTSSSL